MPIFGNFFFSNADGHVVALAGSFSTAVNRPDVWHPPTDLIEMDGGLMILMDLGGVNPEDMELTMEGSVLVVRGIRRDFRAERRKRYLQMEIPRGIFGRVVHLPAPVSAADCSAILKNGVLEIFLPYGKPSFHAAMPIKVAADD